MFEEYRGTAVRITEQWIREHVSERGGWTKKQLAAIGVPWPPPSGWIKDAVGRDITDEQRARFEAVEI